MKVPSTSCTPSSSRMLFLDGIRGIMAINVVLNHFIIVFFPDMIFWDNGANSLNSTPLQAFYNGSIAVTFFFTLSAFLTSYLILQKRTFSIKDLITRIIKRYLRLIPIVLLAVLCTYLLMRLDLLYHLKINRDFLIPYCNFVPNFFDALKDAFVDTFITTSKYVSPFWFLRYDFCGYITTLCTLYIIIKFEKLYKFRRIFILFCLVIYTLVSVQLTAFAFGILLADLYIGDKSLFSHRLNLKHPKPTIICSILGIYLITIPIQFVGIWYPLKFIPLFTHPRCWCALGWMLCLWAVLNSKNSQKILSNKFILFLGKISFPIYAIHWLCMLSLQDFLFYIFKDSLSYTGSALLAFSITFPIIILTSYTIWLLLEKNAPLKRLSDFITKHKKLR